MKPPRVVPFLKVAMKRVLVTGLSGFIGRHCLPSLILRGFQVHAISSSARPDSAAVTWHEADLLDDHARISEVVNEIQPTHLLHLAWYTNPRTFWTSPENVRWQQASARLFDACAKDGVRRIVVTGSCAEYQWNASICGERSTPLEPHTLYGQTKNETRRELEAIAERHGISSAWCRVFFLYGPHAHPNRMPGVVISSLLHRQPALCSHGEQLRDFIHVRDAADAIVSVLDSRLSGPVNIASGQAVRIKDMVLSVADRLSARHLVRLGAVATNSTEPAAIGANTTRLRDELGWTPKFDLESGIDDTIQWWQDSFLPAAQERAA